MADLLEPMSVGAVVLVGSVATITYLAVFLPHYWLGWWGGIADLFKYYNDVVWYEKSVSSRHASVRLAMVELAADAAADRVLAELSEDRRRADGLGRRQSAAVVGRADRDHDHRGAGDRAPER